MISSPLIDSVLVIGVCGALGHRLVTELLDLETPPQNIYTQQNRVSTVQYHEIDISDKEQVNSTLGTLKPLHSVIFHTASPRFRLLDLELYLRANVEGTRNLLGGAEKLGVKAFVYTSSASVIHDAVTLVDELILKHNNPAHGFLTTSIWPSSIFGENDPGSVKSFAEKAAAGKLKFQIGNGKNLFDFTYVENLVHAHILAAQKLLLQHATPSLIKDESMRVDGQAFLITNDEHIPFWEFARAIGDAAGHPTRRENVKSIPKIVGFAMAIVAEWVVWIMSFGREHRGLIEWVLRIAV
ncbi:hypothetical protein BPAE_0003g01430 [Botrytis paeoniae]|uniref:3-beta hydroxysteroid dehydrogenase/isomerase domain-containing protein n=1 Tax=Botrytis paeoniae TaxID=278948 RepID=A0A4Z1GA13_9HELO|nr:hypothetical protein BPAE_0003g01430 [Botrytis paeoniae]